MGEGRVRQVGSPLDLYRRPADAFVAGFIGSTNLLPAKARGADAVVPGGVIPGLGIPAGSDGALVSIRPEDVGLTGPETASMRGSITFIRDLGASVETYIECEGYSIVSVSWPRDRPDVSEGDDVGVVISPDDCVILGR
jgi:putative spermidine/putrescine transport system ATP-binding protein